MTRAIHTRETTKGSHGTICRRFCRADKSYRVNCVKRVNFPPKKKACNCRFLLLTGSDGSLVSSCASSYRLSFFQKLALCRGLDFALPQPVSPMEIQATFEKAYWKLEPKLSEENKELAAAMLRSIALNYMERKGPTPPKSMLRAIGQFKKRDDIVITRPDKGSGVVILDKTEYVSLLKESSISHETKFIPISLERPKAKGRPPKHYHPLLKKEKEFSSIVKKILPQPIADSRIQKGSRLAHLYCLPKTHKTKLAVRPILSATGTYNYKLAKWLDENLKPLSVNDQTINDISLADDLQGMKIDKQDILVSYDVSSLQRRLVQQRI